jgi:SAM-dependent methyltransferase
VDDDDRLAEQIRYYEDRAPTYEDLYFRRGAYDLGPEGNAAWFAETARLEASLQAQELEGDVLELGCGNGLWTRWIAPRARTLLAVDASSTMLARNRAWVADPSVDYVEADVFAWTPPGGRRFDVIAFGFFLSHVPPSRVEGFWGKLARWLAPGGVAWFADDCWAPDRPRSSRAVDGAPGHAHLRRLGDREYQIVKVFYRPDELEQQLVGMGWDAQVTGTGEHFLVGTARPRRRGEQV